MRYATLAGAVLCLLIVFQASLSAWGSSDEDARTPPDALPPQNLDDELLDGLPVQPRTETPKPAGTPAGATTDTHTGEPSDATTPPATSSDSAGQHPLLRVSGHMLQVQQRLSQRDLSLQTQQAQNQIVAELDALIASLAAQQQSTMQRSRNAAQTNNQQASRAGTQAAEKSSEQTGANESHLAPTDSIQQAASEIWGHLPERYRRQMQSAEVAEFLPQYRKLIEDYYRRLAEDRDN